MLLAINLHADARTFVIAKRHCRAAFFAGRNPVRGAQPGRERPPPQIRSATRDPAGA